VASLRELEVRRQRHGRVRSSLAACQQCPREAGLPRQHKTSTGPGGGEDQHGTSTGKTGGSVRSGRMPAPPGRRRGRITQSDPCGWPAAGPGAKRLYPAVTSSGEEHGARSRPPQDELVHPGRDGEPLRRSAAGRAWPLPAGDWFGPGQARDPDRKFGAARGVSSPMAGNAPECSASWSTGSGRSCSRRRSWRCAGRCEPGDPVCPASWRKPGRRSPGWAPR